MKRKRRRLLVILGIIVAVALLVIGGGRYLLTSRWAADQVARRLAASYGARVDVQSVDVGLFTSTARGVRLYELGAEMGEAPWATVDEVQTPLGLYHLLTGSSMPKALTLERPAIALRFDEDGALLTRFPGRDTTSDPLPQLTFRNGTLTLQQVGRPDMVLIGCHGVLDANGRLEGKVNDTAWGDWLVAGTLQVNRSSGSLTLTSVRPIAFTQEMLEGIPFVPRATWEYIQIAEGLSPAVVRLDFDPDAGFHHRIALDVSGKNVKLPFINLAADQAQGKVLIEDGVIFVEDLHGTTADGRIDAAVEVRLERTPPQVNLRAVAQRLNVRGLPLSWALPPLVEGRLSGRSDLRLTFHPEGMQMQGDGFGTIGDATLAGVPVLPIGLKLINDGDHLRFWPLAGWFGKATGPFLEITLTAPDADVATLLRALVKDTPVSLDGRVTADLRLAVPLSASRDVNQYVMEGTVTGQLLARGWQFRDAEARLRLRDGVLHVTRLKGLLEDGPVEGSGSLTLSGEHPFEGQFVVSPFDLSAVRGLSAEVRPGIALGGQAELQGRFDGTLSPFRWCARGTASVRDLQVERLHASRVRGQWIGNADRLHLTELHAELYQGSFEGEAVAPLRPSIPGAITGHFQRISVPALAKDLLATPWQNAGRVSGSLRGTIAPADAIGERSLTAHLNLHAPGLRVQGIPLERLHASLTYYRRWLAYDLEGDLLGGRFEVEGQLPPAGEVPEPPVRPPRVNRLDVRGAQLAPLIEALGLQATLGPLRGVAGLTLTYQHEGPDRMPVGSGRVIFDRLYWKDELLGNGLRGDLRLTHDRLRLQNFSGALGQGLVRGQVSLHRVHPERSWFTLDVDQVEAATLLAPWPDLAAKTEGAIDGRLRGRFDHEWSGSGQLTMVRGKIAGVEVRDWRIPLDWRYSPATGRGQVEIRETSAQVAQGRATGKASLGWGVGSRVEGRVRFHDVDLRGLLGPSLRQLGAGRMSGRLDLSGADVRSLDDLNGVLDATFSQTQGLEFPVLRQLVPYVAPGRATTTFRTGELRAHLSRGVVRVHHLNLVGPPMELFAAGTVTLQGRVDLDVTVNTGQVGLSRTILRLVGAGLALEGNIPLAVLLEATNELSNRLIYLRVTGTVRNPTVRLLPLPILTEAAIRFFLNRTNVPFAAELASPSTLPRAYTPLR